MRRGLGRELFKHLVGHAVKRSTGGFLQQIRILLFGFLGEKDRLHRKSGIKGFFKQFFAFGGEKAGLVACFFVGRKRCSFEHRRVFA